MAKRDRKGNDPIVLVEAGAAQERRLLKRERRAERELADLRADLARDLQRLERAKQRVEGRLAELAVAEARLRARQAERAAGQANRGADGAGAPTPSHILDEGAAPAPVPHHEGGTGTADIVASVTVEKHVVGSPAAAPAVETDQAASTTGDQGESPPRGEGPPVAPPLG